MRPSPLQLRHVLYKKVSVIPHSPIDSETPVRAVGFEFDGINIQAKIGIGQKVGQEDDPRDFIVNLEIKIDGKEGKPAPYLIDIGVVGVFNVLPSLQKEKRKDLVTVNGASILYGVIREIVLSLTSRFAIGPMTLPGMNFEDTVVRTIHPPIATETHVAKEPRPTKGKRSPSKKR